MCRECCHALGTQPAFFAGGFSGDSQKAAMKICGPAASKQSTPGYAVLNCVDDTHCREASGSRGLQMFRAGNSVSVGPVATNALVFSVVSSAFYTSKPK